MPYVQTVVNAASYANNTTHTINIPVNTTRGNFLILDITLPLSTSVSTVSDSKGNTWSIDIQSGGNRSTSIASCTLTNALTTSDTITFTVTGSVGPRVHLIELQGMYESNTFGKTASSNAAGINTISSGSTATLENPNQFVYTAVSWNANPGTVTPPSGFTDLPITSFNIGVAYKDIITDVAPQSATWSWANNNTASVAVVTYKRKTIGLFAA